MSYRRYRRSRRSGPSRTTPIKHQVTARYFGLDHLIRPMFFKLDQNSLRELLRRYQFQYGIEARNYAERTYPKWKDGSTGMSGMVVERLILLLPHVLSVDDKYILVRHLRERTRTRPYQSFSIKFLSNVITVRDQIKEYIRKDREFTLPEAMVETLTWLANNDAKAAEALLRAVADREARDSLRQLDADLLRLGTLIQTTPPQTSLNFVVDLPQIRATIYAKGNLPMSDPNGPNQSPVPKSGALPAVRNAGDLLAQSFDRLSADDKSRLAFKANEEALRLKVRDTEAQLAGRNADSDIDRLVGTAQKVGQQQGIDFDIKQTVKTESGQMNVHIEKKAPVGKPFVWVIAAAVFIVVLILITRK